MKCSNKSESLEVGRHLLDVSLGNNDGYPCSFVAAATAALTVGPVALAVF